MLVGCLAVIALVVLLLLRGCGDNPGGTGANGQTTSSSTTTSGSGSTTTSSSGNGSTSSSTTGASSGVNMTVAAVDGTRPTDFDMTASLFHGPDPLASFKRSNPISFGPGKDYTALQGIITFRGNNYRDGASYGTADVKTAKLAGPLERAHRLHRQSREGRARGRAAAGPASRSSSSGRTTSSRS